MVSSREQIEVEPPRPRGVHALQCRGCRCASPFARSVLVRRNRTDESTFPEHRAGAVEYGKIDIAARGLLEIVDKCRI